MEITMYDTLLQLPLFQGLCKNDFTSILGKVKLHFRKYNADEIIVEQGEPCTELIFLLNGEISSQIVDEQKSYSLHETFGSPFVLEPYSLFGMHPNYIATYRARTDLNLVSIDKAFVLSELNNYEIFRLNHLQSEPPDSNLFHLYVYQEFHIPFSEVFLLSSHLSLYQYF